MPDLVTTVTGRVSSRLPWQRTIVGDVARLLTAKTGTRHHHYICFLLYHLRNPLSKLNYNIPEVDERKRRRNLVAIRSANFLFVTPFTMASTNFVLWKALQPEAGPYA